jgi:hypothetical protein
VCGEVCADIPGTGGWPTCVAVCGSVGLSEEASVQIGSGKAGVTIGAGIVKAGVKTTIKTPEPLFPPALIAKRQACSR